MYCVLRAMFGELDALRPVITTKKTVAKVRKMKTVAKMIKKVVSPYVRQQTKVSPHARRWIYFEHHGL